MSIRAFEAASRLGSFQAAADELGRVPSAISHQIRQLELQLGVALFQKKGRHRVLTEDGVIYAKAIDRAFDEISQASEQIASRQPPRLLKVSTSPSFMTLGFLPRLDAFRARHPEIKLEFEIETGVSRERRDDVDAFVQIGGGWEAGMVVERLWESVWMPVTTPQFAQQFGPIASAAEIGALPLIHHRVLSGLWFDWFRMHAPDVKPPEPTMFFDNGLTALQLVEGGGRGVLLGLFPLMSGLVRDNRLVVLRGEAITSSDDYQLVYRRALVDSPKIKILRSWIRSIAAEFRLPDDA